MDKTRKRTAWMFWESFFGRHKGPCLFWEKSWGSITPQKYCGRIVPLVVPCIEVNPGLQFMQDNAPPHKAAFTRDRLRAENMEPIIWAAYSPDLNPIEAVWSKMKDFIEVRYPDLENGRERITEELRRIIQEAWDSIDGDFLGNLIHSMPTRCQAVFDAQRGATKY